MNNSIHHKWRTYNFREESLGDRLHGALYLYTNSVARFVFSEPVTALILTVKPLQPRPPVGKGSKALLKNYLVEAAKFLSNSLKPYV